VSAGRIIGIAFGVIVLLVILVFGAGYYWFQTHGTEFKAQGQVTIAEATEFGKSTDNQGCLAESLTRYDRCENGFTCNVMNNVFLLHCLRASAPVPGFCDSVPRTDSMMDSVGWRLEQCEKYERSGTHCGNLFGQIQEYCDSLAVEPAA